MLHPVSYQFILRTGDSSQNQLIFKINTLKYLSHFGKLEICLKGLFTKKKGQFGNLYKGQKGGRNKKLHILYLRN